MVVAKGRCLESAPINEPATFTIDPSKAPFKADAVIQMQGPPPLKRSIRFKSKGNYLEGWTVDWVPKELGVHTIDVKYGNSHVQGSPFRCKVYDLSKVQLQRDSSMEGVDLDGIPGEDIVFFGELWWERERYKDACLLEVNCAFYIRIRLSHGSQQ